MNRNGHGLKAQNHMKSIGTKTKSLNNHIEFKRHESVESTNKDVVGDNSLVPTPGHVDTGQRSTALATAVNYTLMPGEIFDMNVQCQLVFGQSSKICPWMKVCSRLWCLSPSGKSCKTQHMPWAEGTHCGHGNWCMKGSCVPINRSVTPRIDGQWGPWSKFTTCSRTCGGGINQSTRECNSPRLVKLFYTVSVDVLEVVHWW